MPGLVQREQETVGSGKNAVRVGMMLRSARQAHNLTVREVAERIHLSAHYLYMLEGGDYSEIADELYLLPFVQRYARFLKLDVSEISKRFLGAIEVVERPSDPPVEIPDQEHSVRRSGWSTTATVTFFVALAIFLIARSIKP
jgi:cytoskeletal protein RodZ